MKRLEKMLDRLNKEWQTLKPLVLGLVRENRELRRQREELWALLDNIDTLDDAARDNDVWFREKVRVHQKKRWAIYAPPETTAPLPLSTPEAKS